VHTEDPAMIAIAGAGRMGLGIALSFAYSGHRVVVVDMKAREAPEFERLQSAFRREVQDHLQFLVQVAALDAASMPRVLARIAIVPMSESPAALAPMDVIFEAVPEFTEAKEEAFTAISSAARGDALIASTTSTFGADQLALHVRSPERFLNAHWLNPAHLMPLVEISPCSQTSAANIARLRALLQSIGKVPVVCKSSPGYIVPRIQALAMNEAARLVEEGVASAEDVDTAVRTGFGLRFAVLGLLEFIDWGGGDILYYASKNLAENLDAARFAAPEVVSRNMQEAKRGIRDGEGFYDYRDIDIARYREQRLAAFVALLRHRGLMPVAG
jgi:3-hydroxybutyryl-CoA dehydrogenase